MKRAGHFDLRALKTLKSQPRLEWQLIDRKTRSNKVCEANDTAIGRTCCEHAKRPLLARNTLHKR